MGLALASLLLSASGIDGTALAQPYLRRIVVGSLIQASLSTLLSLLLGAALALALDRLRNRQLARACEALLALMAVAPAIVVVLGIVGAFGRSGFVAQALGMTGLPAGVSIFGLQGILAAHVAMNAPFAARVFLQALRSAPPELMRLAEILAFRPIDVFRLCDWPLLRREAVPIGSLVLLLCFTSFAVVLTLGGGPANATPEVAIYEALRVDLDFGRAGLLALMQVALGLLFLSIHRPRMRTEPAPTARLLRRADRDARLPRILDAAMLIVGLGYLGCVLATPLSGLARVNDWFNSEIATALRTSLTIAVPAAVLATSLALAIAVSVRRSTGLRARLLGSVPLATLAMPPFALIAGLYLPVRRVLPPEAAAYVLVPLVNALMALPFAYRLIAPQAEAAHRRYARLADHLDLAGWRRLMIVDWPLLKPAILASLALAAAFSFGDFGVATLFAGAEFGTLPLLLQERMAAYRMAEAEAIAALILAVAFALSYAGLWISDAQGG